MAHVELRVKVKVNLLEPLEINRDNRAVIWVTVLMAKRVLMVLMVRKALKVPMDKMVRLEQAPNRILVKKVLKKVAVAMQVQAVLPMLVGLLVLKSTSLAISSRSKERQSTD
jgi:hypothetical protein